VSPPAALLLLSHFLGHIEKVACVIFQLGRLVRHLVTGRMMMMSVGVMMMVVMMIVV
jgi:hypothetical protein